MRIPALLSVLSLGATLSAQLLPPATTGDLLVSSSQNNKLLRLAFDGTQLAEFSYARLTHPRGIVVAKDGIYLASQNTNEVLVLDPELKLIRRFATKNVTGPTGAALGPNGNLYVAGFSSNNIGEYKTDGTFVRVHTATGLLGTNCVAFRKDGGFYAASAFTNTVLQFTPTGTFVRSLSGFGLSSPMGIAIWNGEVYVAGGGSSNIVVFDSAGKALRQIRHADMSGPQGLAFTHDGILVASNYFNNKVTWFDRNGTHRRTVAPKSASVPRSVAFLHGASLEYSGNPKVGVPFAVSMRSPFDPFRVYATALALAKTPGLRLADGRVFDLTPDALFFTSIGFPSFVGALDGNGSARVTVLFPNLPGLKGLTVYGAGLTVDPQHATLFRQLSAAARWTLQ